MKCEIKLIFPVLFLNVDMLIFQFMGSRFLNSLQMLREEASNLPELSANLTSLIFVVLWIFIDICDFRGRYKSWSCGGTREPVRWKAEWGRYAASSSHSHCLLVIHTLSLHWSLSFIAA